MYILAQLFRMKEKQTFTSAVKAAAARNRPFCDNAAMLFLSWFVSTTPSSFPLFPCQSLMLVSKIKYAEHYST